MHKIMPYERWNQYYNSSYDERSPFAGKEYNYELYSDNIYGYYIDPAWDYIGSETLYIKIIYVDYEAGFVVIEMLGEWNDALNNDIMQFKRNILEHLMFNGINKFALIGESVMNFHGSDDCYYEEWFDEVEEARTDGKSGWLAGINFHDHVQQEMKLFNIDNYVNMSGSLQIDKWRTMTPMKFCEMLDGLIMRRLSA